MTVPTVNAEPVEIFELNFQANSKTIRKPAGKTTPLLPQQPEPVDRLMMAMSRRFLYPAEQAIMELFQELRRETDEQYGRTAGARYGKPYPYGYCREITFDVIHRLRLRLDQRDRSPGALAIGSFMRSGGRLRCVWGVLRDTFFQTAMQLGDLYIDVANDTVTITKPKVEILPLEQSGLIAVRDLDHYLDIARRYWQVEVFANDALPGFADYAPVIMYRTGVAPQLQPLAQYMVEMTLRDGFRMAEKWLRTAPPPPPELVEFIRRKVPPDLLASSPATGREAAITACQSARAAGVMKNKDWRKMREQELVRCNQAIQTPG